MQPTSYIPPIRPNPPRIGIRPGMRIGMRGIPRPAQRFLLSIRFIYKIYGRVGMASPAAHLPKDHRAFQAQAVSSWQREIRPWGLDQAPSGVLPWTWAYEEQIPASVGFARGTWETRVLLCCTEKEKYIIYCLSLDRKAKNNFTWPILSWHNRRLVNWWLSRERSSTERDWWPNSRKHWRSERKIISSNYFAQS
jgi:hypothetical protein